MLLPLLLALTAHAYDTTHFTLGITRENIRDQGPAAVGTLPTITVRYDGVGDCFLLGQRADYPCSVKLNTATAAFELTVDVKVLAKLVDADLAFTAPQFQRELNAVMTRYTGGLLFLAPDRHAPKPELVRIVPVGLVTPDSKTTYQFE